MKFFHVYDERYYEGLVKNNLINEDTGYKLMNVFRMPEDKHFNAVAAKGGHLHSLIKENKNPFYIDRIAGGTRYYKFNYDKELIREYSELLGKWFLGFQLHESGTNRCVNDWGKILAETGSKGPYDVELLNKLFFVEGENSFYGSSGRRTSLLEQGNPEEYASFTYPETEEELFADFERLYKARMADVDGHIVTADSLFLLTKLQDELGINTFMPEVGWQIEQTRVAASVARGIASAKGKLWGLYYEPWFLDSNKKYSIPKWCSEADNEWFHDEKRQMQVIVESGPNSGSSRLLQRRIYYYALMAGADYLSEEWGTSCSYLSKRTFELSPYGEVKKEFIEFARGYKTVKPVIPFAIVLPLSYKCIQICTGGWPYEFGKHTDAYIARKFTDMKRCEYIAHVEDTLKLIYARNKKIYGNESFVLTNSRFGDLFDIIYEDAPDEVLLKYEALIDATPDGIFAAKRGENFRVLESKDFEKLENDLRKLSEEVLPVTVDSLHWLISKDAEGRRFLTIFNNEGNVHDSNTGDTLLREADARAKVTFKEKANLSPIKLSSDEVGIERVDDTTYYVDIHAAGFAIFEF